MDGVESDYKRIRVRMLSGNSCEAREEFTIPGDWYFEQESKFASRGPFQRPSKKIWLVTGLGYLE